MIVRSPRGFVYNLKPFAFKLMPQYIASLLPEAVGFYKDDVIKEVRSKFGYGDKPEIFQLVLGDLTTFARAQGERKTGVVKGRKRTLYSLRSTRPGAHAVHRSQHRGGAVRVEIQF